jgi:hypothetical protein
VQLVPRVKLPRYSRPGSQVVRICSRQQEGKTSVKTVAVACYLF